MLEILRRGRRHLEELRPEVDARAAQTACRALLLGARLRAAGIEGSADDPLFPADDDRHEDPVVRAATALRPFVPAPTALPLPTPGELARLHQELESSAPDRKDRGAYFTAQALVQATVRHTLQHLPHETPPRVLDPAAGAGAFLLGVLEHLAPRDVEHRREILRTCLFGIEQDPLTASVLRWSLWLAVGAPDTAPAVAAPGIVCGDGLRVAPPLIPQLIPPFIPPFIPPGEGVDAVVGNPPWDTVQPMVREFFAAIDPGFGGLDRSAAKARMAELLAADPALRRAWQAHCDERRAFSKWARSAQSPFSKQGPGKLYTYRLFVERSWQLLRSGGVLGMVLPAGLYLDSGAGLLRRMLLDEGQWHWLYGFENRNRIFPIDSRYRFAAVVATKGGSTSAVRAAFHRRDVEDWARGTGALRYERAWVRDLCPTAEAFVEVRAARDLALLAQIHERGAPFVAPHGPLQFAQGDYNMTSDAAEFVPCAQAEADGWRRGADDRWHHATEPGTLAPLHQGGMVWNYDPVAAGFDGGGGHGTRWRRQQQPLLAPQFLVSEASWSQRARPGLRTVFRALSNATNERTVVASCLWESPCGNSVGCLSTADPEDVLTPTLAAAVMGSLTYDWAFRIRMGGTNLNRFLLQDTVWPAGLDAASRHRLAALAAQLAWVGPRARAAWQLARRQGWMPKGTRPAATRGARQRIAVALETAVAAAFGLDRRDLEWILRDCAHPVADLANRKFCARLDPKGFWRVDRTKPPSQRHTVRVLAAAAPR